MNLQEFLQNPASVKPHFLLLGNPVGHSLSPLMHNTAAAFYGMDVRYHAIALGSNELNSLPAQFNRDSFRGANITIPYKEVLKPFVDRLDTDAMAINAINTIVKADSELVGYNTDAYGFGVSLAPYSDELEGGRALVFGTGGACKAIIVSLRGFGVEEIVLISRNPDRVTGYEQRMDIRVESYGAWTAMAEEASLIVNATPLGMEPEMDASPVREQEIAYLAEKICYDIVYKPVTTTFLKQAERAGARTISGIDMLINQGSRSFELWTGKPFPLELVKKRIYERI